VAREQCGLLPARESRKTLGSIRADVFGPDENKSH
jgi:hypothetical protein